MPRPRKVTRPVHKKIAVPEDIAFKVDMELYSAVDARVPQGAWAEVVTELLKEWLQRRGVKLG